MAGIESFPRTLDLVRTATGEFALPRGGQVSIHTARDLLRVLTAQQDRYASSSIRDRVVPSLSALARLYGAQGAMFYLAGEIVNRSPAFHPPGFKTGTKWVQGYEPAVTHHWEIPSNYVAGASWGGGPIFAPNKTPNVHASQSGKQWSMWGYPYAFPVSAPNYGVISPTNYQAKDFAFGPSGQYYLVDHEDDHPNLGSSWVKYFNRAIRYDKVSGANTAPTEVQAKAAVPAIAIPMTENAMRTRRKPRRWLRHLTETTNGDRPREAPHSRASARSFPQSGGARNINPPRKRAPPVLREHHRKGIANTPSWYFTRRLFDELTETEDLIDAFYECLPDERKAIYVLYRGRVRYVRKTPVKNLTYQEKAKRIWRYRDEIPLDCAIAGVFFNEIEDRLFAYLGRKGVEAIRDNPYYRRPVGIQTGPAF